MLSQMMSRFSSPSLKPAVQPFPPSLPTVLIWFQSAPPARINSPTGLLTPLDCKLFLISWTLRSSIWNISEGSVLIANSPKISMIPQRLSIYMTLIYLKIRLSMVTMFRRAKAEVAVGWWLIDKVLARGAEESETIVACYACLKCSTDRLTDSLWLICFFV